MTRYYSEMWVIETAFSNTEKITLFHFQFYPDLMNKAAE